MMQVTEAQIRDVVQQVLARIDTTAGTGSTSANCECSSSSRNACACNRSSYEGRFGIFTDVNEAVSAATAAFDKLSQRTIEDRGRIIQHIRRIAIDQSVELGTMEMEETKIGRLDHKIEKLKTLGEQTPGVEFMKSEVFSGDRGLAVIGHRTDGDWLGVVLRCS